MTTTDQTVAVPTGMSEPAVDSASLALPEAPDPTLQPSRLVEDSDRSTPVDSGPARLSTDAMVILAVCTLCLVIVTVFSVRRMRADRSGFKLLASKLGLRREEIRLVRTRAGRIGVAPVTLLLLHGRSAATGAISG